MAHLEGNGSVAHLQRGAMALSGKACVLPVSVPVRVRGKADGTLQ